VGNLNVMVLDHVLTARDPEWGKGKGECGAMHRCIVRNRISSYATAGRLVHVPMGYNSGEYF
jgi:hypothetical protein